MISSDVMRELSSREELALATAPLPTQHSIAFYMQDFSGGGVERMRLSLIKELRARGIAVTLIVGVAVGPLKEHLPSDLPMIELCCSRTLLSIVPLARALRTIRPSMLVTSLDHNNVAALVCKLLSFSSCPVVICQHNALSAEKWLGWKYRLIPIAYRCLRRLASSIVAVSDGVADDLAEICRIPRHEIITIYNPVIGNDFHDRANQPVLHSWFLEKRAPIFVFVGRLISQKNPQILLEAFGDLVAVHSDAKLIFIGDGPLSLQLQEKADLLGLAGCVEFVGFQSNPLPWIRLADALVLTSDYEGFGNVIAEALALATPVVATDCPWGPSEILQAGRYGLLVPCNDAKSTSTALKKVLEIKWDEKASELRGNEFTASACAQAHLALLEQVTRARRSLKSPKLIFGLPLAMATARSAVDFLFSHPPRDSVRLVVTPNLDHLQRLRKPDFAAAYKWAHLCFADGFPLVAYARFKGLKLRTRVTGCEIFHQIAHHPNLENQRLFVVVESEATRLAVSAWAVQRGMADQVLCVVARKNLLTSPLAQLSLAGSADLFAPTILIMTLGAPLSELFIHRHRDQLPPCWAICVGQAVRVELGLTKRAPLLWQSLNLEWLWRVQQEPRRLTWRYLKSLAWFPVAVFKDIRGR